MRILVRNAISVTIIRSAAAHKVASRDPPEKVREKGIEAHKLRRNEIFTNLHLASLLRNEILISKKINLKQTKTLLFS